MSLGQNPSAKETLADKIRRVTREPVKLAAPDPQWPVLFEEERAHLLEVLPNELIRRIEHFGSTAVPGLMAKPIVDVLIEVTDLGETRRRIAPILEAQGYDYFWRPTRGDDVPPFYAWFIKRDRETKQRTHHLHMVERTFEGHWDRLFFRDYLREFPEAAKAYQQHKLELQESAGDDRVAYTEGKTDFIGRVTAKAKEYYISQSRTSREGEG